MPFSIFIAYFCSFSAKIINKFFLSHFSQNFKLCTLPSSQIAASSSPIGLIKKVKAKKIAPWQDRNPCQKAIHCF
jgi:hypothetical protein